MGWIISVFPRIHSAAALYTDRASAAGTVRPKRGEGKAFSRDELLNHIWGYNDEVETRVTDETLRRIRSKLSSADSNVLIETVWGYGYRLRSKEGGA